MWPRADKLPGRPVDRSVQELEVPLLECTKPVLTWALVGRRETMSSFDLVSQYLKQGLREDESGSIRTGAVALKIRREDHDGHASCDGKPDFHAYAVIQTRAVQDGDHAVDEAQPLTIHLEQAAALAVVDEIFLVSVAERKKDGIRTYLAREPSGNMCPQRSIVSGKQPVRDIVENRGNLLSAGEWDA